MVVNTPVDSTTYWAPASPHLMLAGSLLKKKNTRTGSGRAGVPPDPRRGAQRHLLVENGDGMSVDDQLAALGLHLALVAAVGGVILEHVDLKVWKESPNPRPPGVKDQINIVEVAQRAAEGTDHVLQVNEGVIDGHDLHLLGGEAGAGHQTADAAESENREERLSLACRW